jgi:hypothetical protein
MRLATQPGDVQSTQDVESNYHHTAALDFVERALHPLGRLRTF